MRIAFFNLFVLSFFTGALFASGSTKNFKTLHKVKEKQYKVMSANTVIGKFKSQPKIVVTFVGYSGKGYENEMKMLLQARKHLEQYSPKQAMVNIGVTPDGIGAIYKLAKSMGFETSGVVSKNALPYLDGVSHVDHVYLVEDESWGGYDESGKLNPTSRAMVDVSQVLIGIGGGDVGYAELREGIRDKKVVFFHRAEMNRQKAIAKAKKKGKPTPTGFYGKADEIHALLYD